jgi:peptide/nickel transport system substrate-binding protein
MSRKRRVGSTSILALLVLAALLAAGCGSNGSSGKSGGIVRIGTSLDVDSLNPFTAVATGAGNILAQIYPSLLGHDPQLKLKPDFATSWTPAADFKSITFKVHTNGKWSDGQPMTSDDVAWTINTVVKDAKGGGGNLAPLIPDVASAVAPDASTVVVHFSAPSPDGAEELEALPILPKHIYAKYATGKDGKGLQSFANAAPAVGGGPFYISKFQRHQFLILQRNPGYYGTPPHVDRIGFTFYSNPDALTSALLSGEIDAANPVPPSSLKALTGKPHIVLQQPNSLDELLFTINSSPNAKHKELQNPLVRKAIDAAVDRARIIQVAYFGSATPGEAMTPTALGHWHAPIQPPAFDLAHANQLLDQAGYKRGSDGIRVANGRQMKYTLIALQNPGGPESATSSILQSDFQQLGIKVTVSILDGPAALSAVMGNNYGNANADMFLLVATGTTNPSNILSYEECSALGAFNFSGYCSKAYDALFAKQQQETDPVKREAEIHQLQQMLSDAGSDIALTYARAIYAYNEAWTGFDVSPLGWFAERNTALDVRRK